MRMPPQHLPSSISISSALIVSLPTAFIRYTSTGRFSRSRTERRSVRWNTRRGYTMSLVVVIRECSGNAAACGIGAEKVRVRGMF